MQIFESETLLWQQFQRAHEKGRLPQALLLIAVQHLLPSNFAYKMSAAMLCSAQQQPCGQCKSCRLSARHEHPDLFYLQPDKEGGIIKIDQIRDLQTQVFTSPQLGQHRVVIINPADRMNEASANAILKILEEPPSSLYFILITETVGTIPVTILSRCQQWHFPSVNSLNYLALGKLYPKDSERGKLFDQLPVFIQDLTMLLDNQVSTCSVAAKWSAYPFNDLLWFLYLVNAQMINFQLCGSLYEKEGTVVLSNLAKRLGSVVIFKQLSKLTKIMKNLKLNINMNQVLVLENFLLAYKG